MAKLIAPWPEVKGIFVGGCVCREEGNSFRATAHAHSDPDDPYQGWICIRSIKRVYTVGGAPSRTLWHEYAHILTPDHGHDSAWGAMMAKLDQPWPKWYKGRFKLATAAYRKVKRLKKGVDYV